MVRPAASSPTAICDTIALASVRPLAALRFVLGDQFDEIRADNKRALLHVRGCVRTLRYPSQRKAVVALACTIRSQEGGGSHAMQAMVTVVLDNADGRMSQVEGKDVTLSRIIGAKKVRCCQ